LTFIIGNEVEHLDEAVLGSVVEKWNVPRLVVQQWRGRAYVTAVFSLE